MLTCQESLALLDRYCFRDLAPGEEREMDSHLMNCQSCAKTYAEKRSDIFETHGLWSWLAKMEQNMTKHRSHAMTTLSRHPLMSSETKVATPGNFAIEVRDGIAYVPQNIMDLCKEPAIHSLEGMLSMAWSFPSCIINALGWNFEETQRALSAASEQLKGIVSKEYLQPPPSSKFSYGALSQPEVGSQNLGWIINTGSLATDNKRNEYFNACLEQIKTLLVEGTVITGFTKHTGHIYISGNQQACEELKKRVETAGLGLMNPNFVYTNRF